MASDEKIPTMSATSKPAGHDAKRCGGQSHQTMSKIGAAAQAAAKNY